MKKLFIFLLTIVTVVCFAACNQETNGYRSDISDGYKSDTSKLIARAKKNGKCVREYDDDGELACETYYENGKETYVVHYTDGEEIVSNAYRYDADDKLIEAIRFEPDGTEYVRLQYRYTPDGELDTVIKYQNDQVDVWDHISEGQNTDYPHSINAIW